MSMVINLVEDHNIYLCEGGPVYNGGTQPITYLTQWKIVGNSEVHTLPYPDGAVLPTGYTRCKYLEFHDTEWIDSGIIPEQGIAVSVNCEFTTLDDRDCGLLGCREGAFTSDSLYLLNQRTNHQFVASYGGAILTQNTPSNPSININQRVSITLDSNKAEIIVNGNTFVQSHTNSIVKGDKPIFIGQVHNAGYAKYSGKIYSIRMSLNDALVFNGIPCLDDNGVPCLYDTVSGTSFYNDGTGTFGYEIEPQPTEIWSCGEYNPTDGKYHILVQPLGGSIADIALTEPLRKANDIVDIIEFSSDTEGKALVTRPLKSINLYDYINFITRADTGKTSTDGIYAYRIAKLSDALPPPTNQTSINGLCSAYIIGNRSDTYDPRKRCISVNQVLECHIYDPDFDGANDIDAFKAYITEVKPEFIYELGTPTTELIDAPQIAEADSYSMVISQGGKAVEWSSFTTE